jgi:putative hydrolase of the HAD superfamily
MSIRAVTFDAAGTLIEVRWNPGAFALDCARNVGLRLDEAPARERYERLLQTRWIEYTRANETKDHELCRLWWRTLTLNWLESLGEAQHIEAVMAEADRLLYGPEQTQFRLFEDALPAVRKARKQGLKTAVVSNWDYSLHRVLEVLGARDEFDEVVASLEEGMEKPDPRLFRIALDRLEAAPGETLHVGDDPLDDVSGALGAGMRAVLLDRRRDFTKDGVLATLLDLSEALEWSP